MALTPRLAEASEKAAKFVRTTVLAETLPRGPVILVGVGNAIGIE